MHQLFLELAGLRIRLCSDAPVSVGCNVEPFLAPSDRQDILLELQAVEALPPVPKDALVMGTAAYCRQGGELLTFHLYATDSTPLCCTRQDGRGNAVISYLQEQGHLVQGTNGVLSHAGLESLLLAHDGLMLHAAFVRCMGKGILFAGPSGIGKSTQAGLWQRYMAAEILNGDRAALRCEKGIWKAWGLPFAGTSRIFRNESAPISAVVVLRQAKENRLRALSPREAFSYVFPELSLQRWDAPSVDKALKLLLELSAAVPVYLLECLPEESAVRLLRETLEKEQLL